MTIPTQDEKVQQIRYAAYRCFKNRGYHETTVDSICREAGVSKGAFYWYFKSKQEVFLAILEAWAAEVEGELAKQFRDAVAASDPIDAITVALEMEARRERKIMGVWLDFLAHGQRDPAIREAVALFHHRIRKAVAEILSPFLQPRFDPKACQTIAGVVVASFVGMIMMYIVDPDEADFNEQMGRFMPVLRSYLKSPPASAREPSVTPDDPAAP
jgi:AcrR family transcriptional regulator